MIPSDPEQYDDNYPTCEFTHATLRVYHATAEPGRVSELLNLRPDESLPADSGPPKRPSSWLLSSEGRVRSRDVRRHIDWVLQAIDGRGSELQSLRGEGFSMDVLCRWDTIGQGGPQVSPQQMLQLANLNLTLGFDIYGS